MDDVSMWLQQCGLPEYVSVFKSAGYDDINLIKILNESDLDAMGIDKPGTRKKLLLYADELKTAMQDHQIHPIDAIPIQQMPVRPKSTNRANPYRCTKCCEYKIRSLDGKAHQCNPDLIGHSWENCPTKNIRQHPEEKQRRKETEKQTKPRSRKRKNRDDDDDDDSLNSSGGGGWDDYESIPVVYSTNPHHHHPHHGVHEYAYPDDHRYHFAFDPDTEHPSKRAKLSDLQTVGSVMDNLLLEVQLESGSSQIHSHGIAVASNTDQDQDPDDDY